MFTGLVREVGRLRTLSTRGGATRIEIEAPLTAPGLAAGDSVAVNGICLTVVATGAKRFAVEAVAETRRLTTLAKWRSGQRLHLEPALRVGDPLDGHLMQGHVDGVGTVRRIERRGGGLVVAVTAAAEQRKFLTPKGSVAVDGVSLTVDEGPFVTGFAINLIPHTLQATHFAHLRVGDRVNLEMDVLVKAARTGDFSQLPRLKGRAPASSHEPLTVAKILARGFARPRSG